jgi:hypothetical protein
LLTSAVKGSLAEDAPAQLHEHALAIPAAINVGVAVIGYANKPGKAEALSHAGARAVVTDVAEIMTALRAAPSAALPN